MLPTLSASFQIFIVVPVFHTRSFLDFLFISGGLSILEAAHESEMEFPLCICIRGEARQHTQLLQTHLFFSVLRLSL